MHQSSNPPTHTYLQLPAQVLPLELLVFPHVAADHSLHLLRAEEQTQTKVVHA